MDADKYKDYSGWDRLVGQFGMRYISQELAVKILADEIEKVRALGDAGKKELDKLYSIMLTVWEDKDTKSYFDDDETNNIESDSQNQAVDHNYKDTK